MWGRRYSGVNTSVMQQLEHITAQEAVTPSDTHGRDAAFACPALHRSRMNAQHRCDFGDSQRVRVGGKQMLKLCLW